jgi:hypothetical protein
MNRTNRSSSNDPTEERTTDQSTQSASGLSRAPSGAAVERTHALDRDLVNRRAVDTTPRRYDQPIEDDEDPISQNR